MGVTHFCSDDINIINITFITGILKFFGHIGHKKPRELVAKYPTLFDHLFSNIESSDLTIIAVTLDVLGYVGQTSQGKIALGSTGNVVDNFSEVVLSPTVCI